MFIFRIRDDSHDSPVVETSVGDFKSARDLACILEGSKVISFTVSDVDGIIDPKNYGLAGFESWKKWRSKLF